MKKKVVIIFLGIASVPAIFGFVYLLAHLGDPVSAIGFEVGPTDKVELSRIVSKWTIANSERSLSIRDGEFGACEEGASFQSKEDDQIFYLLNCNDDQAMLVASIAKLGPRIPAADRKRICSRLESQLLELQQESRKKASIIPVKWWDKLPEKRFLTKCRIDPLE